MDVVGKVQSGKALMTRKEIFSYLESWGWLRYKNENSWTHYKDTPTNEKLELYTYSTDCAYRKTKAWEKELRDQNIRLIYDND